MSMLGSQFAMPILVLNMGGEMVYILHQRLQAQNIPEEKARKVLEDVLRTMYTPMFLEELFKPQEVYSNASTKQIFDKLAHSSIMRLNKTSMEKLYDLMSMGVKYQLLSCSCPQQYLHVTINHLDSLMQLVDSEAVNPLVQSAATKAIRAYSQLSPADWMLLEQTLMQFFQGRKVKVSLFLQQNLQTATGVLVLSNRGNLPYLTERPGSIRYFENDHILRTAQFHSEIADLCLVSKQYLDPNCNLGKNMYITKPTESPAKQTVNFKDACSALHKADLSTMASSKPALHTPEKSSKYSTEASAKAELSLLADLLGVSDAKSPAKGAADDKPFKINLFPTQHFGAKSGPDFDVEDESYDSSYITLDVDGSAGAKTVEHYMSDLRLRDDDFKAPAKATMDDDEDDLLALMDSAK